MEFASGKPGSRRCRRQPTQVVVPGPRGVSHRSPRRTRRPHTITRLGQPGRVGGERLGGQWVGLGVVVHAYPPGRPTSKASGRGAVTCQGPDQARFVLVSLTTFWCWSSGLDGHPATEPPAEQEGKRPSDADLLRYLTPTGCSTPLRRAFDTAGCSGAMGRWPGGPLVRVGAAWRSTGRPARSGRMWLTTATTPAGEPPSPRCAHRW